MYQGNNVKGSLTYGISIRVIFIVAVLFIVLILSNVYSLKVVTRNMIKASQSEIAIHVNNIENNLNSVTRDINEISVKYSDNIISYQQKSEFDKYTEALELRNVIAAKVSNNTAGDGLFILDPNGDLFLVQFSNRIFSNEKINLIDYLNTEEVYQSNPLINEWGIIKINKLNYLVKRYNISGIIVGALVKADSLISFIYRESSNQAQYILTDENGNILSFSDRSSFLKTFIKIPNNDSIVENFSNKYFIITEDIPALKGKLSSIIERKSVFSGLELIQWVIIALGIVSIFVIPIIIFYLFKQIIKPVNELVTATKEIEKGNLDYEIPIIKESLEFIKLKYSFNSMIKEIKSLKIKSYEEEIELQKAELRYLQMQIKPHFFLNAITTISSLTYQNKNEEIRQLISFLSKHLRYALKGGLVKVSINEEIEHVKNYIGMQEIKFPGRIFCMIEIEPDVKNYLLPQFLLQTFVENIFKHAFDNSDMLSIFIKAKRHHINNEDFIRIIIEDNGDGFPDNVIEIVNNSDKNVNSSGEKIGIINIKKTLNLLYKRDGLLKISNVEPFGAKVEIMIPIDLGEKNADTFS